jgi:hypothetical protein
MMRISGTVELLYDLELRRMLEDRASYKDLGTGDPTSN